MDSDYVVALSVELKGDDVTKYKYCGKKVRVHYKGKTVVAAVVDTHFGGKYDLDLSPAAFSQLAEFNTGKIAVTWSFQD
ncbi:RlpA-like double-psi beta-barrel domain-containing protein [Streptomyces sp. QH1-20]|uniref:RlpA-like double-psi beta-barrel domain-containing protein n=1 Tax=Streptomyces sp. QH1-20 TaxID=3240934 RepID=UPI0035169B48